MTDDPLAEVRRTSKEAEAARADLHRKIRRAAKKHSLRAIAAAAGISHEQVRRIVDGKA